MYAAVAIMDGFIEIVSDWYTTLEGCQAIAGASCWAESALFRYAAGG